MKTENIRFYETNEKIKSMLPLDLENKKSEFIDIKEKMMKVKKILRENQTFLEMQMNTE